MGIIYSARNLVNGKRYIGATTSARLATRRDNHLASARNGGGGRFYAAIREFGASSFEWTAIFENVEGEELDELERESIQVYQTLHPDGYNLATGGVRGWRCLG